jgi:hypothetical protein
MMKQSNTKYSFTEEEVQNLISKLAYARLTMSVVNSMEAIKSVILFLESRLNEQ